MSKTERFKIPLKPKAKNLRKVLRFEVNDIKIRHFKAVLAARQTFGLFGGIAVAKQAST